MTRFTSVYIHYPFCLRKCHYCDFVSLPREDNLDLAAAYPELLRQELALWQGEADLSGLCTVYFGGGTPSLLEPEQAASLLALLPTAREITLEANPETVVPDRLAAFRAAGVNRLSLGVQSFQPRLLKLMGRCHSPEQAVEALASARAAGFDNIGLDLIYGLPEQTLAQWQNDVEEAVRLAPEHISLYALALSEHSPWGRQAAAGQLAAAADDLAADMEELAVMMLRQAGYCHYEIANFARPGYESLHNTAYWQRANYLGLGAAAASCAAAHRWANQRDPYAYGSAIRSGSLPRIEEEWLTIEQVIGEALFLGLRLLAGIRRADFAAQYGVDPVQRFKKQLRPLIEAGLLEVNEQTMRLTEKGVLLSNRVFAEFV